MSNLTPREIISNIHEIGSLPQTLAAVLRVLNNPNVGADEIAEVISKDVSLTSRVLKMVNSAQYSRSRKVTRVSEAVIVMGLNSIKMLTLSSSVFGMIPDKHLLEKLDVKRIWRHLIETATSARRIAEEIGHGEPEEAFVAGILHDIGIILLILHFKDKYISIIENIRGTKSGLLEAEKEAFGFTHGDIGAEMINAWKLPPKLAFVAQNHHSIDSPDIIPEESKLSDIVALADRLTLGPFDNYYPDIEGNIQFVRAAREKLNLSAEATNVIRKESIYQAVKLAEYLDLDVGEIIDIIMQANEQLAELYFSLERLYLEKTTEPSRLIPTERLVPKPA